MTIYDTFLLGSGPQDLDLLECRLYELQDLDLIHIITEADETFTGLPKPRYYMENQDRFAAWKDRIYYLTIGHLQPVPVAGAWGREHQSREAIRAALQEVGAHPLDVILLSDVDEIPNPGAVARAADLLTMGKAHRLAFGQRLASFAVDWLHDEIWHGTCAALFGNIETMSALRTGRDQWTELPDGGWHLSWLGGRDAIEVKALSCSHTEMVPRILDGLAGGEFIEQGLFWGRDQRACDGIGKQQLQAVDVDDTWPRWIVERRCPDDWFRPR